MNIESLITRINLFTELVFDSGFRRDVHDYIQSIQQGQNQNLVFMKELSQKIRIQLEEFENQGLNDDLNILLRDNTPFTELPTLSELEDLDSDNEIEGNPYFSKFNQILNELLKGIDNNKNEIDNVKGVFEKYTDNAEIETDEDKKALVSLIFKDLKSTGSLKEFSQVLNRWNRTLLIYHSLLSSESPEEITLVEIQNGSIDVIFNIDFDIAIDLTELITKGLKVYGAYLLYKSKTAKEIIASYMGNKKLLKQEEEREKLMLENIKESIESVILEQHKQRLKTDKKIDKTSIPVKVKDVSTVVTDHIVKGNELKLLTPPPIEETEEGQDEEEAFDISAELRKESAFVRDRFKKLNAKDKQLLLDKYTIKDEETEEKK
jgi:hypothetical protein